MNSPITSENAENKQLNDVISWVFTRGESYSVNCPLLVFIHVGVGTIPENRPVGDRCHCSRSLSETFMGRSAIRNKNSASGPVSYASESFLKIGWEKNQSRVTSNSPDRSRHKSQIQSVTADQKKQRDTLNTKLPVCFQPPTKRVLLTNTTQSPTLGRANEYSHALSWCFL